MLQIFEGIGLDGAKLSTFDNLRPLVLGPLQQGLRAFCLKLPCTQ